MTDATRILVIHLNALGDLVRGTAVCRELRRLRPDAFIAFLTETGSAPALYHNPFIDDIYTLPFSDLKNRVSGGEPIVSAAHECLHGLIQSLRARRFELVVDLHFTRLSALLSGLVSEGAFAGLRLGVSGALEFSGPQARRLHNILFTTPENRAQNKTPLYALYTALLRDAGLDPDIENAQTHLCVTEKETTDAKQFLKVNRLEPGTPLVGMHPGAGWKEKRWPVGNFIKTADYLHEKHGAAVLITGTGNEVERLAKPIAEGTKAHAILAAGKTNLRQTMALITQCKLYIAGETGPMHIAAALGTPTLALFASPLANEARPSGPGHAIVVADDIQQLSAESVIESVNDILQT